MSALDVATDIATRSDLPREEAARLEDAARRADNVRHAMTQTDIVPWPHGPTAVVEPAATPGLGITAGTDYHGRHTGMWHVVHVASGRAVAWATELDLGRARELAVLLGKSDVDWTYPTRDVATDQVRAAVEAALGQLEAAIIEGRLACPRRSWVQIPPVWHSNEHDADERLFFTWPQVLDFVDELASDDPDAVDGELVVRDQHPSWMLRCASSVCPDEATLEDEQDFTLVSPDRRDLVHAARATYWRELTARHWLCPRCVDAHPHIDAEAWATDPNLS